MILEEVDDSCVNPDTDDVALRCQGIMMGGWVDGWMSLVGGWVSTFFMYMFHVQLYFVCMCVDVFCANVGV